MSAPKCQLIICGIVIMRVFLHQVIMRPEDSLKLKSMSKEYKLFN